MAFTPRDPVGVDTAPAALAIGDINGDGRADIVAAGQSGVVSLVMNGADGSFAPPVTVTAGGPAPVVVLADIDLDNRLDLVIATATGKSGRIDVLLNTVSGPSPSFGPRTSFTAGSGSASLAVDDFDGDGRPDLAIADPAVGAVSLLLNRTASGAAFAAFDQSVSVAFTTSPVS